MEFQHSQLIPMANTIPSAILMGIDIESTGSNFIANGIPFVGVAAGVIRDREFVGWVEQLFFASAEITFPSDRDGSLWNAASKEFRDPKGGILNWGNFERRCWDEFWSKNLDVLTALMKDHDAHRIESFADIRTYIDSQTGTVPRGTELSIITDNPAFDIGRLDYLICRDTPLSATVVDEGPLTLNYIMRSWSGSRVYNSVESTDNLPESNWDKCPFEHTHNPVSDAKSIVWKYAVGKGLIDVRPL